MPWIIRNANGEICGRCTNKPGEDNFLPDGSQENVEFIEEDTPESLAFLNRPRVQQKSAIERLLSSPADLAELKAALAKQ